MKSILKCLLIISLSMILYGCAGAGDFDIDLSGGYSLIRSSAHMVTINKRESEAIWGEAIIPAKVIELAWNDNYILAKREGLKLRNPDNPDDRYEIPDESKIDYWILDVENGEVYGKLNEQDFIKKKNELGVPNSLILKDVDSYK